LAITFSSKEFDFMEVNMNALPPTSNQAVAYSASTTFHWTGSITPLSNPVSSSVEAPKMLTTPEDLQQEDTEQDGFVLITKKVKPSQ
jgi:hypothetical protein